MAMVNKTEKTFSLKELLNSDKRHFKKMQLPKLDAYDLSYGAACAVVYIVA